MKLYLVALLALIAVAVEAAQVSFEQLPWTNAAGVLRPRKATTSVEVTNLNSRGHAEMFGPLVLNATGYLLSLGTNTLSVADKSSFHLLSLEADPATVVVELGGGTNNGHLLYLLNTSTNAGFTLRNNSTNGAGGYVFLQKDWTPTNRYEALQLLYQLTNWIEVGRSTPSTNGVIQDLLWRQDAAGVYHPTSTNKIAIYPDGALLQGGDITLTNWGNGMTNGEVLVSISDVSLGGQNLRELYLQTQMNPGQTNRGFIDLSATTNASSFNFTRDSNGVTSRVYGTVDSALNAYLQVMRNGSIIFQTPFTNAVAGQVFTSDGAGTGYWGPGGVTINSQDGTIPVRGSATEFTNSPLRVLGGVTFVTNVSTPNESLMNFQTTNQIFTVGISGPTRSYIKSSGELDVFGTNGVVINALGNFSLVLTTQVTNQFVFSEKRFAPGVSNTFSLGTMELPWKDIYSKINVLVGSDGSTNQYTDDGSNLLRNGVAVNSGGAFIATLGGSGTNNNFYNATNYGSTAQTNFTTQTAGYMTVTNTAGGSVTIANGNEVVSGTLKVGTNTAIGATNVLEVWSTINSTTIPSILLRTNGNVGIGTTSPGVALQVNSNTSGEVVRLVGSNANYPIRFSPISGEIAQNGNFTMTIDADNNDTSDIFRIVHDGAIMDGGTPTELFRVQENGNVGIDTTAPTAPLHVFSTNNPIFKISGTASTNIFNVQTNGDAMLLGILSVTNGVASYSSNLLAATQVTLSGTPALWTNTLTKNIQVTWNGGTVTGVAVNNSNWAAANAGGYIILQPNEWLAFTNSGVPAMSWKPL